MASNGYEVAVEYQTTTGDESGESVFVEGVRQARYIIYKIDVRQSAFRADCQPFISRLAQD